MQATGSQSCLTELNLVSANIAVLNQRGPFRYHALVRTPANAGLVFRASGLTGSECIQSATDIMCARNLHNRDGLQRVLLAYVFVFILCVSYILITDCNGIIHPCTHAHHRLIFVCPRALFSPQTPNKTATVT